MIGLIAFGLVILFTVPFSIWPGGAFGLFTDTYLKLLVVFVPAGSMLRLIGFNHILIRILRIARHF